MNTPVGVANGGVLQHIKRDLTITCLPDKLIDSFQLDVSGLDIGDSVHIRDIELPVGITSEEEVSLTVALVAAPTVEAEKEEEEEMELEAEAAEQEAESTEEPSDKEKGGE
jgi:large subunit ribosomal protein L25